MLTSCRVLLLALLTSHAAAQYFRGVNLAGDEFGASRLPGVFNTDYTFNSLASYRYFAARNLNLIRLPLQWERLQLASQAPLDPQYLGRLKTAISWAAAHGAVVILDVHNFARYSFNENGKLNAYAIDQLYRGAVRISRDDLADLWMRLSSEFVNEPAVYAYNLMNEPHDLAGWKEISQHVLTAIRNSGDNKLIMVPGDNWSSANRWPDVHGPSGWITDQADNFMYEAHQYFDFDESGTYARTYDAELKANPALGTVGRARVSRFLAWCANNNARCFLGEYGIPDSDPRWRAVLDDFLNALDDARIGGAYWAAGEWWGAYPLSVQPSNNYTVDRPQMPVLLAHLPPGSFTSVSSASNAGATFAPGSMMTGYGANLPADAIVELTDGDGAILEAPVTSISPGQINYLIPAAAAPGRATVAVLSGGAVVGRGTFVIERVAPTLFSSNGDARGPAAAQILRVKADGARIFEPQPVDFGDSGDLLFVTLYGTGFRNADAPSHAILRAGAQTLPISYIGPHPETQGLDQIDAELPRSLAGAGELTLTLQVDAKTANPVTLTFR